MTDPALENAIPGANGYPHKLHKRSAKKPQTESDPRDAKRQAGRLQELEQEPEYHASDEQGNAAENVETKHTSLINLKHRFSNRKSSGGFLVEGEHQKKQHISLESSMSSKGKQKDNSKITETLPEERGGSVEASHTQEQELRMRPKSAAPGSFLSNDVGSSGSSSGRRNVNFEDQILSPGRQASRSPDSHKPTVRTSPFHTPQRSSMASTPRAATESPTIDPSQIVRMALNLSEGRRMHLDPGHVPSIRTSVDRRAVSASVPSKARPSSGSTDHRSSDHGRESKAHSSGRDTPKKLHPSLNSASSRSSVANSSLLLEDQHPEYTFSPATLTRAERAKAYFELANEHRRLLQCLPPLEHNARVEDGRKPALGRDYNPVQFLRNREIRTSSKGSIDAEKAGWTHVSTVTSWVNAVESEAKQDGYVEGDIAHLPRWVYGTGMSTNPQSEANRRNEDAAFQKRFQYSRSPWSTEPSDLLADVYWLEQDDHKKTIRAKNGSPIFKSFWRPARPRAGTFTSSTTNDTRYTTGSDEDVNSPKSARDRRFSSASFEGLHNTGQDANDIRFSPQQKGKASAVKRHLLGKRKGAQRKARHSSGSESERSLDGVPSKRGPKSNNIGPLERHMKKIMEKEQEGQGSPMESSVADPNSPQSPEGVRRGGVSQESPDLSRQDSPEDRRKTVYGNIRYPEMAFKRNSSTTPRVSVELADGERSRRGSQSQANGQSKQPHHKPAQLGEPIEVERMINRASRLGFWKRHRANTRPATAETDFAHGNNAGDRPQERRKSIASLSASDNEADFASPAAGSTQYASSESLTRDGKQPGGISPTTRHFFRAGRIGEIMRSEKPAPDLLEPPASPRSREYLSSDTDDTRSQTDYERKHKKTHSSKSSPTKRRPHSSSNSSQLYSRGTQRPQYHIQNLPSFRPTNASPERDPKHLLSPYGDRVKDQQSERRDQRKRTGLDQLAPPSLDTSDVSPTTSSPDLTRTGTRASTAPTDKASRGDRSGYNSGSGSETPGSQAQSAAARLTSALGVPGTVGKGGLPMTGLSSLDPRLDPVRRAQMPSRDTDKSFKTPVSLQKHQGKSITRRDIAYVRTLLLATGVKSSTIVAKANAPRDKLPDHIVRALHTAGKDPAEVGPVTRQEEHVVAARLLSSQLQSSMSAFDNSAVNFRNKTCHNLNARIDDLRDLVSNQLTHQVHEEGDRADGFVAQLTTTHMLSIKQVNDSVDMMMRKRRQRLRWLRRAGFSILEWVLVGVMWGIWVVVFAISTVKRVIGFFVAIVQWLLFLG